MINNIYFSSFTSNPLKLLVVFYVFISTPLVYSQHNSFADEISHNLHIEKILDDKLTKIISLHLNEEVELSVKLQIKERVQKEIVKGHVEDPDYLPLQLREREIRLLKNREIQKVMIHLYLYRELSVQEFSQLREALKPYFPSSQIDIQAHQLKNSIWNDQTSLGVFGHFNTISLSFFTLLFFAVFLWSFRKFLLKAHDFLKVQQIKNSQSEVKYYVNSLIRILKTRPEALKNTLTDSSEDLLGSKTLSPFLVTHFDLSKIYPDHVLRAIQGTKGVMANEQFYHWIRLLSANITKDLLSSATFYLSMIVEEQKTFLLEADQEQLCSFLATQNEFDVVARILIELRPSSYQELKAKMDLKRFNTIMNLYMMESEEVQDKMNDFIKLYQQEVEFNEDKCVNSKPGLQNINVQPSLAESKIDHKDHELKSILDELDKQTVYDFIHSFSSKQLSSLFSVLKDSEKYILSQYLTDEQLVDIQQDKVDDVVGVAGLQREDFFLRLEVLLQSQKIKKVS